MEDEQASRDSGVITSTPSGCGEELLLQPRRDVAMPAYKGTCSSPQRSSSGRNWSLISAFKGDIERPDAGARLVRETC